MPRRILIDGGFVHLQDIEEAEKQPIKVCTRAGCAPEGQEPYAHARATVQKSLPGDSAWRPVRQRPSTKSERLSQSRSMPFSTTADWCFPRTEPGEGESCGAMVCLASQFAAALSVTSGSLAARPADHAPELLASKCTHWCTQLTLTITK